MSLIKKLAGETIIYGASSILSRVLNYIVLVPFYTNLFLKGEYGTVNELFTYAAFLTIAFTYRMETAFFRFGNKAENLERTFSTASISLLVSTFIFTSLGFIFLQPIAAYWHYETQPEYFLFLFLIVAFDALAAVPFARLRLENRPLKFAFFKILNLIVNFILVFLFLKWNPQLLDSFYSLLGLNYTPANRVAAVFISNMIASGMLVVLFLPVYLNMKWVFDFSLWKKMGSYVLPLIVVGVAAIINSMIVYPFLVNYLPNTIEENREVAGLFGATAKLAVLMNLFTQAFNYAAEPFFFRNSGREDAQQIYADVGQAFAMVGSLVFLGVMLYLDIIQFFLGKNFRTGLEIVPILLLANFCLGLYYNFAIWYKLTDRTRIGGYISIGGVVITLAINYIFIPLIGYPAPAWAALACFAFMASVSYVVGKKYYPIPYPIIHMLAYIGAAVGIYFLSEMLINLLVIKTLFSKIALNTILLLAYVGLIYSWEKATLMRFLK